MKIYLLGLALWAPQLGADPIAAIRQLAQKCRAATEYRFEGEVSNVVRNAGRQDRRASRAKFRIVVSGARYRLELDPGKGSYQVISDGLKTWVYTPGVHQYAELDRPTADRDANQRDRAERQIRALMPLLRQIDRPDGVLDQFGTEEVRYGGERFTWPVLRVTTPMPREAVRVVALTVDPETLRVARIVVSHARDKVMVGDIVFGLTAFQVGEPAPASTFEFVPPQDARKMNAVPIPGQEASSLLHRRAPDFELKNEAGENIKLSQFHGRPVVLCFWANWAGGTSTGMAVVSKVAEDYRSKLVVLGVQNPNREPQMVRGPGVAFPKLEDPSGQVHGRYRVRPLPATFLIDAKGIVVRYVEGWRTEAEWREVLKDVGL